MKDQRQFSYAGMSFQLINLACLKHTTEWISTNDGIIHSADGFMMNSMEAFSLYQVNTVMHPLYPPCHDLLPWHIISTTQIG